MAERVLSIEIGYSLTKVCEIDNSAKAPKIYNSFVLATPEDMIHDGAVDINDAFITEFKNKLIEKGIKTKRAIFTVASNKIATREATIPFVKDKQLIPVVRANLSEYFPVDVSQYQFSHSVLQVLREEPKVIKNEPQPQPEAEAEQTVYSEYKDAKKEKTKKAAPVKPLGKANGMKLLVLAAPKQLLQSYERFSRAAGLELVTVDYNGNSIYQAAKEECKQGVQLIIKVDERSTLLMVLEDGVISLNRTIPYGIDEALATLSQTSELGDVGSYEKALDVARRKTVILSSFSNDSVMVNLEAPTKEEAIKADKAAVTESLRPLVGGIIRVIDFYNSNHTARPIEKMFVTGIGADFSGLSNLLTHESGLKIKNLTHLAGIDIDKAFKDVTYGEYVACIGATLSPLEFYPDHADEKSGKKGGSSSNVNTFAIAIAFATLGIVASIIMILVTLIPYTKEKKLNKEYNQTIDELQPKYDIYLQYLSEQANVEYLRAIDSATNNHNTELIEFIEGLEDTMPTHFYIDSLEADSEGITMSAIVASKDEVAFVLDTIKENELFMYADITSVTFVENDLGEIQYEFTVEMTYMPMDAGEDEEAEEIL